VAAYSTSASLALFCEGSCAPEALLAWGKCYKKLQCNLLPFHGKNNNLNYKQYHPGDYCGVAVNYNRVFITQLLQILQYLNTIVFYSGI
jgi:hypothetical protein